MSNLDFKTARRTPTIECESFRVTSSEGQLVWPEESDTKFKTKLTPSQYEQIRKFIRRVAICSWNSNNLLVDIKGSKRVVFVSAIDKQAENYRFYKPFIYSVSIGNRGRIINTSKTISHLYQNKVA